ncbi:MAG: ABC transporter permease [Myxococcales bacterium]|nr:ABC transporter permease [Myxococcales bacterium]
MNSQPTPVPGRRAAGAWRLKHHRQAVLRSLSQFRTNPVRTFLTLLGMVFGVASVVAMVSIGEGAQEEVLAAIDAIGADSVHVKGEPTAEDEVGRVVNDSVGLHRSDVEAIRDVVPGVRRIGFRRKHSVRVTDLPVDPHDVALYGMSEELFALQGLSVAEGRGLWRVDHDEERRVAVLGHELAARVFPEGALGERIRVDYTYLVVVGVLSPSASGEGDMPLDPSAYDRALLVPFSALDSQVSPSPAYGEVDLLSVQLPSMEDTLAAKVLIEDLLLSLHGDVHDFSVVAPEEVLRQKEKTQDVFNLVLVCIAAISLLVGGIGVMNIMLATIMERVSEIGLRRAVGATQRDIRNQFLLEAVLICFIGGALGIVLGLLISVAVALLADLPIAFAWRSMVVSFAISAGVGLLFGLMPAMRAARVNPIEALRNG